MRSPKKMSASKLETVDVRNLLHNVCDDKCILGNLHVIGKGRLCKRKRHCQSADNLCHTLVEENDGLTQQLGSLRRKFNDTQQCIKSFSKEKEEIHADLRELKTLLAVKEEASAIEKSQLEKEKALMSVSLGRQAEELNWLKFETTKVGKDLEEMEETLHIKTVECSSQNEQINDLKESLERKEKELVKETELLRQERDDIRKGFEATMKDNMELKTLLDKAKFQNQSNETINRTLADNKEKLKAEFQRVCNTFDEMKNEYDMYKEEVNKKVMALEAEIAKKGAEMIQLQMEKSKTDSAVDNLKRNLATREQDQMQQVREIEIVKTEVQKEMASKASELMTLTEQAKNKDKMLKQSDALLTAKERTISGVRRDLDNSKREVTNLIQSNEDLMKRVKKRDVMINEWATKCEKYESERQELEQTYAKKLSDLISDFDTLKVECKKYIQENRRLDKENKSLHIEIESLRGNLVNLTNDATSMKTDIKEMKENKRKFEAECQLLREQNQKLRSSNEQLEEQSGNYQILIEQIKTEKSETIVQLEHVRSELVQLHKTVADRESEVSKLRQDISTTQQEKNAKDNEIENITSQMNDEIEQCKREIMDRQEEVQLAQAKASRERLERETEIVTMKRQMAAQEQEIETLKNTVENLQQELADEKDRVQVQEETVQQSSANGLFSAVDGPCPPSPTPDPPKDVELGEDHEEIISKLQTRWTDVLEEREEIKKQMKNFYRLIDVLMDAKEKLENEMLKQKKKFQKKIKHLKRQNESMHQGEEEEEGEMEMDTLEIDSNLRLNSEDPQYVEANLNNIINETSLYDGHIQYLKHQIGSHYSKAESALNKHKTTMRTVTRMPNGGSLLGVRSTRGSRTDLNASMTSSIDFDYVGAMADNGYKALADKHFQMINELSSLRKEVSHLRDERSRISMDKSNRALNASLDSVDRSLNSSLRSISLTIPPPQFNSSMHEMNGGRSISVGSNMAPGSMLSSTPNLLSPSGPLSPRRSGVAAQTAMHDARYHAAMDVLRRELDN